ncbi:uncharacterized protein LTR77_010570 [Saxophila tyrrhenica]|uniref:Uncharacterized protein n=1 Tax=Saxophila tyrrhenica TaxID=1690608 RepID=A0AAV9NYY1_9PEZI|nr:hypothetical protein LTR77_010570 [Saxophila tyrrhenica]
MSISNDAGHFFQSSAALATTERKAAKAKNKYGDPIKFPSKILAILIDPNDKGGLYVAEAAGEVKKVRLDTQKVEKVFSEGTAPLTSLAICTKTNTLFAGCWDKHIYAVDLKDRKKKARRLTGHTDFVKCLLATSLSGKPVLLSGGADAATIVWDIETGTQLHKLKGHTKALQDLAIDPFSLLDFATEPLDDFVLFSASSDPHFRRWHISLKSCRELAESEDAPVQAHDTSIYKLHFDTSGDIWTASADKTAKHLVRDRGWEADTTLQHPDFVRDVVVVERAGVVVTACRDEIVRVWDVATGKLVCTYEGHFEEVTGLAVWESEVLSGSIDGTVRKWGLRKQEMAKYLEEVEKEKGGEAVEEKKGDKSGSVLTAEEEAELAELMDDD